ncbi:retrovirus-related pol polyprotein from transposon TNT 1-94 [Tanacetum coccineum]
MQIMGKWLKRNVGRQNKNQTFNAGNGNDETNQVVQRVPRTESNSGKANVQCYNNNEKGHYARDCPKPRVRNAKYFREQMLLAMKDEVRSNLNDEEKDFMLDKSFGDETLEELTAAVIMMARIQPTDDNGMQNLNYDAKAVSEVNASHKMISKGVHEHKNHGKCKNVINTSDDDQIDSNIIFYDPYVENNGGLDEHDSTTHDQYHDIKILAYNALREGDNKKRLNNELKKQKMLLQQELETCMFKIDLDPLAPRLLNNREAHINYLKNTQEEADILRGIELHVYVRDTCPNAYKPSEKLIAVTSSLGLVPNPIPLQPCNPPKIDDWDPLFQPMFDEYFNALTFVVSPVPVAAVPRVVDIADSPMSTSIDQDAPSTKPKNFKQAMTESSWIDAMQEEIHKFERLLMRFLALGWLLEEIHVTWTHLEKKQTRLRTYTKSLKDLCKQWLKTASQA